MADSKIPLGGAFILEPGNPEACFTPEDLTDEHRMMYKTAADFAQNEVMANHEKVESKDAEFIKGLFAKAGELGLFSTDVPEEYEGMGLDKMSTLVITEALGGAGSFAVSVGAHTGIGTLPIVYYGNEEQKKKYLPGLALGTKIGAYALTEPGAGSDAVGGCRTKAVLSEDGKHYILNGEKIFITNGAWADTFITFAKIDGAQFSAFIVERAFPGVSSGKEEKKLGINGSSTTPVILEDAQVPVENLLYEPGKGHHIALNVLNIGRYKLGVAVIGGAKQALKDTVAYTKDRKQFGRSISDFGILREKMARISTRLYLAESCQYRTVGLIDAAMEQLDKAAPDYAAQCSEAIREYAVECAICKVFGSEALDLTVDECVQMLGGYGFTQEFPQERFYRDARINRIFEGTNEINRMLVPGEIMKKAMKGKLPFLAAGQKLMGDIMEYSPMMAMMELPDEPLAYQAHMIEMAKKSIIFAAGVAMQKLGPKLAEEQEVLSRAADMIIETFALESGLIRAQKAIQRLGADKASLYIDFMTGAVDDVIPKIHTWAQQILAFVEEGDDLRTQLVGLRKLLKYQPAEQIKANKRIAQAVLKVGGFPLEVI